MPWSALGQSNVGVDIDADLSVNNTRAYGLATFDKRDQTYEGSPLLWDEWTYGKIKLKGNDDFTVKDYQVIFDANRKLLYLKLGTTEYNVDLKMVDTLSLNSNFEFEQKFVTLQNKTGVYDLYEIILDSDNFSFLGKKDVELSKQFYNTALDVGSLKPRMSLVESLYIYRDGDLYEVPKKRKKFLDKYSETEKIKDIVSYFKQNKVNFKKTDEVQNALIELNKIK
ncbi:hypothetical protein GCM10007940_40480 [Portibacter lacus]|uniref:Uncharacterized protein n=1 Tax=Portibacter lacus TaxID=1099794 RepID=A0AA37SSV2_9BACT|nr:hypothetical protein GCM10007940_40480 [Portibacter lacus]